ncbi:EF-Hand 1, calcium-binding site,EF-hand domain pair,EF-hand domain [Cinara cedri]|uniref:EF-Hand 1, calcium-binding site,EF-hand domain pair,EF-hand domain n=1 Tax=Cinara cedri TaxID=506608 RepID=A0A5E4M8K2_9HEMI|nr:EF-Hand 1, calcium-binding site,EF-hand domain pair,EF-hand domain [Cinara cedri]
MDNASISSASSTTSSSGATDGDELSAVLSRRQKINEALEDGKPVPRQFNRRASSKNVFLEFKEFSRKQINEYEATFKKFDTGNDGYLDLGELKRMMEKLGVPQTHLALKAMIKEVDEDDDDKISFREFLLIYRKAYDGSLPEDCGLNELARLTEIDVVEVGVIGAKEFFEAKIEYQGIANRFEYELRKEMEEKKRLEDELSKRKIAFKEKTAIFQ